MKIAVGLVVVQHWQQRPLPQQVTKSQALQDKDVMSYTLRAVQCSTDSSTRSPGQAFKAQAFQKKNLVYFMLAGVAVGIALGAGLYGLHLNKRVIEIIGVLRPLLFSADLV